MANGSEQSVSLMGTSEDDNIYGSGGDDMIEGGAGNDSLRGGEGIDSLFGGEGNDFLDGGLGADFMVGGVGNDTYVVDDAGDVIVELENEGTDSVKSFISYTLGDHLEHLFLLGGDINGTGNGANNAIRGTNAANILNGMAGNDGLDGGLGDDVLIGGAGNDYLRGGLGSDQFVFDIADVAGGNGGDTIVDFSFDDGDSLKFVGYGPGGGTVAVSSYADLVAFLANIDGSWTDKRDAQDNLLVVLPGGGGDQVIRIMDVSGNGSAWSQYQAALNGPTNAAPVAQDDAFAGAESGVTSFDVLANDSDDAPGLTLHSATVVSGGGSVAVVSGQIAFDPDSDFDDLAEGDSRTVVVEYVVEDAEGLTATARLTITVTGSNDAPIAVLDTVATYRDTSVAIDALANDSDIDGGTLSLQSVSASDGKGSASIVDGKILFDPGSDFDGLAAGESEVVSLSYEVSDGQGGVSVGTVEVTVDGQATTPVDVDIADVAGFDSAAGRGLDGVAGVSQGQRQNGTDGENGSDGEAGGAATATVDGGSYDGGASDDSFALASSATGQTGGSGGTGGTGGKVQYYYYTGLGSTADRYYDYGNAIGGSGGDGGAGGAGGDATSSTSGNGIAAYDGGDTIDIGAAATGGFGGNGSHGGSGGDAGQSGRHESRTYQSSPWGGGSYSYWDYRYINSGNHGTGGDGGAGGEGGDAIARADGNQLDGSDQNDALTIEVDSLGGRGGQGGTGTVRGTQTGNSYTPESGDGGAGGAGGDAIISVRDNELLGGAGDDDLALAASARGGAGGFGGGVLNATHRHENSSYSYDRYYYHYGDAGQGGDGGEGGLASVDIADNELLGGAGDDELSLTVSVIGGSGGNGGNPFEGQDSFNSGSGYSSSYYIGTSEGDGDVGADGATAISVAGNVFVGGAGDDLIAVDIAEADMMVVSGNSFDGGEDDDILDLSGMEIGADIDLAAGTLTVDGETNGVSGFETVRGTARDDIIRGTDDAERLGGGGGNDVLEGRGGEDMFMLELDGNDTILDFVSGEDRLASGISFAALDTDADGFLEDGEGIGGLSISVGVDDLSFSDGLNTLTLNGVVSLTQDDFVLL